MAPSVPVVIGAFCSQDSQEYLQFELKILRTKRGCLGLIKSVQRDLKTP